MNVRYGDLRSRLWNSNVGCYGSKDSFWWRNLLVCANSQGIMHNITVKLGNGNMARFWNSGWLGTGYLAELYPSLYQEIVFKNDIVLNMGNWSGDSWCWSVTRAKEVLGLEATIELEELKSLLINIKLNINSADVIIWPFDVSQCFTILSCYKLLMHEQNGGALEVGSNQGLTVIWGAQVSVRHQVPSKLKIFGWRLLRDRLPTRKQLLRRKIILQNQEALCVFCEQHIEEPNHLFILCPKIQRLWLSIIQHLEIVVAKF